MTLTGKRSEELGRELTASELCERTVVVLGRDDRATMYTVWVYRIAVDFVAFRAGVTDMLFIARRGLDDKLSDDTGAQLHVFEYKGEI